MLEEEWRVLFVWALTAILTIFWGYCLGACGFSEMPSFVGDV